MTLQKFILACQNKLATVIVSDAHFKKLFEDTVVNIPTMCSEEYLNSQIILFMFDHSKLIVQIDIN